MTNPVMYAGKDVKGVRVGKLVVVREVEKRGRWRRFECLCDCGNTTVADSSNVMRGSSKSCGCLKTYLATVKMTKHNHAGSNNKKIGRTRKVTSEYTAWNNMRLMCYNINSPSYPKCGGRGIEVCKRWRGKNDFPNFLEDMGNRPAGFYVLARIDKDRSYSPTNCEWRHRSLNSRRHS